MNKNEICDRYKFLYDNVIEKLLIAIENKNYTAVNNDMRFQICQKIWEYEQKTKERMKEKEGDKVLDRHKFTSCICAALIEIKPIKKVKGKGVPAKYANEIFALKAGLSYMRYEMIEMALEEKNLSDTKSREVRKFLKDNYILEFPNKDDNLCDKEDYLENMYRDLATTYNECEYKKELCNHFDVFAYAKIFYHIELYNKSLLKQMCDDYIKGSI